MYARRGNAGYLGGAGSRADREVSGLKRQRMDSSFPRVPPSIPMVGPGMVQSGGYMGIPGSDEGYLGESYNMSGSGYLGGVNDGILSTGMPAYGHDSIRASMGSVVGRGYGQDGGPVGFGGVPNGADPFSFGQLPVVKLRGLPFQCVEADIVAFLSGLLIVDILMVKKGGRMTGEAFVVLSKPKEVDLALLRNKRMMGHRYVEVFRSYRTDYYKAIATEVASVTRTASSDEGKRNPSRSGSDPAPDYNPAALQEKYSEEVADRVDDDKNSSDFHSRVVWMRGLPYYAQAQDVIDFFGDFHVTPNNVHFKLNEIGKASGQGYVVFDYAEDAKLAVERKHLAEMGTRYVELSACSMENALKWSA